MPALLKDVDPDGLLEFSVVFTDRSLNSMSAKFQQVMRDLSATLKEVYNGDGVAIVPGGGTYAMEAVARQFGADKKCMVVRNGWFSYRWTQIFEAGDIFIGNRLRDPILIFGLSAALHKTCPRLVRRFRLLRFVAVHFTTHNLSSRRIEYTFARPIECASASSERCRFSV